MARILICSCFTGRYNRIYIGHEFINLFKIDNKGWNFYVPPYGYVNKDYGKGKEPDYLVMVESINGQFHLIGVATGLEYISDCYSKSNTEAVEAERKTDSSISYFGKDLEGWFKNSPSELYVSYRLKQEGKVYFVNDDEDVIVCLKSNSESPNQDKKTRSPHIIWVDQSWRSRGKTNSRTISPDSRKNDADNDECSKAKRLIGQSQRSYYYDPNNSFKDQIDELIAKKVLVDVTEGPETTQEDIRKQFNKIRIVDILGKEDDERMFSHWFAEYLADPAFYSVFAKAVGLDKSPATLKVKTEVAVNGNNRIDILIETDKEIILIENKIKSSIHGSKPKSGDQSTNTSNESNISQLEAYKEGAEDLLKKEREPKKSIRCFLLCPDYYEGYEYNRDAALWDKKVWRPLPYSQVEAIVGYFINNGGTDRPYIREFLDSISCHTKKRPESLKERLLRKIAARL